MWTGIIIGAISFMFGALIGLFIMAILAAGERVDSYTEGYMSSNNYYERILEEKGLKKNGKWIK